MTWLGWAYGFCALLVLVVALVDRFTRHGRNLDWSGVLAGAMLLAMWGVSNLVRLDRKAFGSILPLMDLFGLYAAVHFYRYRKAVWKIALAFCFLSQLALHVAWATLSTPSPMVSWRYWTGLDIFFVLSLLAIGSTGARRGLVHLWCLLAPRGVPFEKVVR